MLSILSLFAKSPFAPLQSHMEKVSSCVHLLPELFLALAEENEGKVDALAKEISEKEHFADLTKNDIRNHLPNSLFLPIDRTSLLEILALQDSIADKAEDVAVIVSLKKLPLLARFETPFHEFVKKNIETFDGASAIIHELHELLESSFGGVEAEKVRAMVDAVAFKEHEADLIQRELLKSFFSSDEGLSLSTFHLWQRSFESIASISNLSEKLAYRVRMTLELK